MPIKLVALAAAMTFAAAAPLAAAEEHRRTVAPGVELRVLDAGPRNDKPPVVLITGWGMSADVWSGQAARLAKDRRVVSFDPRSQGRSSRAPGVVTPERRAADLEALLSGLGLSRVVLVGWSQGVQDIAAYVQAHGAGRVAGLVLVDAPVASGAAGIAQAPAAAAQQLRLLSIYAAAPEAYARGMVEAIVSRKDAPEAPGMVADILSVPTDAGVAMLVSDLFGADRTAAVKKFDRPTLVVAAAGSPELQAQRDMAAAAPHARVEVIEAAGHAVFVDQPDRFAEVLGRFLAEIDAGGGQG